MKDPSGESIILPPAEFERITSTSHHILTKKEREVLREAYEKKKEEEIVGNMKNSNQNCPFVYIFTIRQY